MLFLINFYKFLECLCYHISILALEKYKILGWFRCLILLYCEIDIVFSCDTLKGFYIAIRMDTSDSDLASSDTAVSAFDNYVSKNNYLKSVYGYLNNLYARWHKPEKALEYKEKWLNTKNEQNKNITHRNA